jgi:hypothetical protein
MFAVSEGEVVVVVVVVVVVITQNEMRSPPSHVWSEGGGLVPAVAKPIIGLCHPVIVVLCCHCHCQ